MIKLQKRVISFAASITMLASAFPGLMPLSVSAAEPGKLVYSQDFSNEATVMAETRLESSPAADLKVDDISMDIVDGALKISKNTAAVDGGTSENYSNLIKFGDHVVEETGYTKTYLKDYKGVYTIKADITLDASSSKQMIGAAPYTMSGGSSRASSPFVIHPSNGFGYYHWKSASDGGTKQAYLSDKQGVKKVYTVDTVNGKVTGSIDGSNEELEYQFVSVPGSADYTIDGLRIGMKPAHAQGESVTVDNIEVYEVSLADAQQKAVDAAAEVTVDQNIDGASVELPKTVTDGTVAWKSSDNAVIDAASGAVTQTDAAQDVKLTATVTAGDAAAYKEFNVTVAAKSNEPQNGVVVMNNPYTGDLASTGWKAAAETSANGTLVTSAENGLTITKTAGTGNKYSAAANFDKYQTKISGNSKTYTAFANGKTDIEFEARFDFAGKAARAFYLDFMGVGISGTDPAPVSLGRVRVEENSKLNAYAQSGVNGSSTDTLLKENATGAWLKCKVSYDLANKCFDFYIDGEKVTSTPLKATNWSERKETIALTGFAVEISEDIPTNSSMSLRNVKVTQVEARDAVKAEIAADTLTVAATAESDITLPTSSDATVTWVSSNSDVISNEGVVTRGVQDETVTLTATVVDDQLYTVYKEFTVTVPKVENPNAPEMVLARAKAYVDGLKIAPQYSNVTGDLYNLETSWTDEGSGKVVTITWKSSNPDAIGDDGTYKAGEKPEADINVTMTATLSLEGQTVTSEHALTIKQYSDQRVVFETNFQEYKDQMDANGEIPALLEKQFDGYEKSEVKNSITSEGLVFQKATPTVPNTHGEKLVQLMRFKNTVDQDENTVTYFPGFSGKYQLDFDYVYNKDGQGTAMMPAGGNGSSISRMSSMFIGVGGNSGNDSIDYYDNGGFINIGKGSPVSYVVDTVNGKFSVKTASGGEHEFDASGSGDGYTLGGFAIAMKPSAGPKTKLTIKNVKVTELENALLAPDTASEAAKLLTMDMVTDTPEEVVSSVTLPESIEGRDDISISWASSDENVIDREGNVTKPVTGDSTVILTATISIENAAPICKDFTVVVPREDDPDILLDLEDKWLTEEVVLASNASAGNVSKNLNMPVKGQYGSDIVWTSSDEEYVGTDGVIKKLGDDFKDITVTATISVGGKSITKSFEIRLAPDYNKSFFKFYESDFTGAEAASNLVLYNGKGVVSQKDGKIYLDRTSNTNTKPSGGEVTAVNFLPAYGGQNINWPHRSTSEVELTLESADDKFEIMVLGHVPAENESVSSDRATVIYSGKEDDGRPYFQYVVHGYDAKEEKEKDIHTKVYYAGDLAAPFTLRFKFDVDTDNHMLTISYKVNGGDWVDLKHPNDPNATDLEMRENIDTFASLSVRACDNTNDDIVNNGIITVNEAYIGGSKAFLMDEVMNAVDYYGPVEDAEGNIAGDIELKTNNLNGLMDVSWTSSNPSILSNDGKVNKENLKENTDVVLTFEATLKQPEPAKTVKREFPLTVHYRRDDNLVFTGEILDDETIINASGHGFDKAVDGYLNTSWQTMRGDDNPYITIDFGKDVVFNQIVLSEAEISGKCPVTSYVVEVSSDTGYNKKWKTVVSGTALGVGPVTHDVAETVGRYVRYRVVSKDKGNSGLNEFQIFVNGDDSVKAEADITLLLKQLGSLKNLKEDVDLPETGQNGSRFSYESSIPDNFSNEGEVTRESKTVSGTLTITAELNGVTVSREVPVSVAGTNGNGGGTGNGGGSGSGSTSSSGSRPGTAVPSFPVNNNNNQPEETVVFPDVDRSYWAYEQIKELKDRNIVNGDANGKFNPENPITREEFVKMLLGAFDITITTTDKADFTDIAENDWCAPYVAKAVELGIVKGISETEFGKGMTITREDMAVMCTRAMAVMGEDVQSGTAAFADNDQISDYAADSIGSMAAMGIINGYSDDNTFRPKNNAKRSEAAKIICMIMK